MAEIPKDSEKEKAASDPALSLDANSESEAAELAQLDALIAEEDPEFAKNLEAISQDSDLASAQLIDDSLLDPLTLEKDYWKNGKFYRKLFYYTIPFLPHLSLASKRAFQRFVIFVSNLKSNITHGIHYLVFDFRKKIVHNLLEFLSHLKHAISNKFTQFKNLTKKQKLSFAGLCLFATLVVWMVYKTMTTGLLPTHKDPFLNSFESVSDRIYTYNAETEVEPLYESIRVPKNIIEITKIVVNLKRINPESNPMIAFDLYIEGTSQEVVVELQDRMGEFRDLIQRTVEGMTADQLEEVEGKARFRDRIKSLLNQNLTTGQVRKVLLKTLIIKSI